VREKEREIAKNIVDSIGKTQKKTKQKKNTQNKISYDGGGEGNGTWCIFHVASDSECSSAA
jgi:hypothetical protein